MVAKLLATYHSKEEYHLKRAYREHPSKDILVVDANGFTVPYWPMQNNIQYPVYIYSKETPLHENDA